MVKFESPTCALDLRHRSNGLGIASAKPGQEIRVLVRPEDDTTAQLIVATGTLSNDGKSFSVVEREQMARSRLTTCATGIS